MSTDIEQKQTNPWIAAAPGRHAPAPDPVDVDDVAQAPAPSAVGGPVFLAGAHGGAGVSTLAHLTGLRELARPAGPGERVIVVARTHARGMGDAQHLLAYLTKNAAVLEGLVLVPDAPGRTPKALTQLADLLAGTVASGRTWRLPWVEAWRLESVPDTVPGAVRRVVAAITATADQGTN